MERFDRLVGPLRSSCWLAVATLLAVLPSIAWGQNNVTSLGAPVPVSNAEAAGRVPPIVQDLQSRHTVHRFGSSRFSLDQPYFQKLKTFHDSQTRPVSVDVVYIGRAGMDAPATNIKMTEIGVSYSGRIWINDRMTVGIRPIFETGHCGPADLP